MGHTFREFTPRGDGQKEKRTMTGTWKHGPACQCPACIEAVPELLKPLLGVTLEGQTRGVFVAGAAGAAGAAGGACNGAYPDNNPKTAFGALKPQIDKVPPALLIATAKAMAQGAEKYGPYNWREKKISSSVYYAAFMRHVIAWWEREDNDPDSGGPHLGHACACLALLLDTIGTDLLNDDRPKRIR